jgi:hypothetical protein
LGGRPSGLVKQKVALKDKKRTKINGKFNDIFGDKNKYKKMSLYSLYLKTTTDNSQAGGHFTPTSRSSLHRLTLN